MSSVLESILQFGKDQSLTGNWTIPANQDCDTAVIIMNAGTDHRAGPNRLYPELAQSFCAAGLGCLRFDYSGIGDSAMARERRSGQQRRNGEERRIASADAWQGMIERRRGGDRRHGTDRRRGLSKQVTETEAALDALTDRHNIQHFILFGLCTGADDALRTAHACNAVIGLIMIDGFGWRTRRWYSQYYLPRILSPQRWLNLLRRKLGMLAIDASEVMEGVFRSMPEKAEVQRTLPELIERGVALFVAYTGEEQEYYCYANQFHDMLPGLDFNGLLDLHYLQKADHSFGDLKARESLKTDLTTWLGKRFSR